MSGAPNIKGTNQLPKPPKVIGITKKKIITKPWEVTTKLYKWASSKIVPGWANSIRIITLKAVPIKPDQKENNKYKVPMSLWLALKSQRRHQPTTPFQFIKLKGLNTDKFK